MLTLGCQRHHGYTAGAPRPLAHAEIGTSGLKPGLLRSDRGGNTKIQPNSREINRLKGPYRAQLEVPEPPAPLLLASPHRGGVAVAATAAGVILVGLLLPRTVVYIGKSSMCTKRVLNRIFWYENRQISKKLLFDTGVKSHFPPSKSLFDVFLRLGILI